MPKKEGRATITLAVLREELKRELGSLKTELIEHMDKKFAEHELYFTAIQDDLLELKKADARLEIGLAETRKELKDFRTETKSFQSGFAMKSGRQDAVTFRLAGILQEKNILTPQQAAELRTA